MRGPLLTAAALALLAASAASASAAGAATPRVTTMRLAVQTTAIHVVDWHVQDAAYPDPKRAWVQGHGTQTLGFSDRRAVTYLAIAASGRAPDGTVLQPLALTRTRLPQPLRASLRRTGDWHVNDAAGCDREGGCDDDLLARPLHFKQACAPKRVNVPAQLEVARLSPAANRFRLLARFDPLNLGHPWANCPPDMDGVERPLTLASPPQVAVAGGISALAHLRRGATLTLEAERRQGAIDGTARAACPKLAGPGLQECATTHVTVEVRRLS